MSLHRILDIIFAEKGGIDEETKLLCVTCT